MRVPPHIGWPLLAVSGYAALALAANRSAYIPMKYPAGLWDLQRQLGAEDVWLRTGDGVRIHAWWVAQPGTRLATLYLHGNAGNVTHRSGHIREITAAGSSILIVDYRGYGKSSGWPTEAGLYRDARAAYGYLRQAGFGPERIVLHGESLGTAVAVELASLQGCAGLVLEAPFTSARDVARSVLPGLGPLLTWGFNSRRKIPGLRVPLLVLHGERDEVIPVALGRALYEAANPPKSFWQIPGATHNDMLDAAGPQYRERLRQFYGSLP